MADNIEAPCFSTGQNGSMLMFRIDEGKYMDSVFSFTDLVYNEETKKLEYGVSIETLIINGVQRNKDHLLEEELSEFYSKVSTPILTELREQFSQA